MVQCPAGNGVVFYALVGHAVYVIFFLPLALSTTAAVMVLFGNYHWFAKTIVVTIVAASVLLQFVPALQESVHFLVPLFIQIAIGGGYFLCLEWFTYIAGD
jgi:hypothetical protein